MSILIYLEKNENINFLQELISALFNYNEI